MKLEYIHDYKTLKKGMKIKWEDRMATLLTDAEYISTPHSGLFYADVEWEDGYKQNFMLCRVGYKQNFMLCRVGLQRVIE